MCISINDNFPLWLTCKMRSNKMVTNPLLLCPGPHVTECYWLWGFWLWRQQQYAFSTNFVLIKCWVANTTKIHHQSGKFSQWSFFFFVFRIWTSIFPVFFHFTNECWWWMKLTIDDDGPDEDVIPKQSYIRMVMNFIVRIHSDEYGFHPFRRFLIAKHGHFTKDNEMENPKWHQRT